MALDPDPPRPFRRRWFRRLVVAVALAVIVTGGVSAAAYFLIDKETLRARLEQELGRPVKLGGTAPGLLGLGVRDLELGDTAGFRPDPLLYLGRGDLSLSWWRLLTGEVRITELELTDGILNIEFDTAGGSNLAGLIRPAAGESALKIEAVTFENCAVNLTWPSRRVELAEVTGTVANLDQEPYEIELAARIAGAPVSVAGTAAPNAGALDLRFTGEKLPWGLLGLPPDTIQPPDGVNLTTQFTVRVNEGWLGLAGKLAIANLVEELAVDVSAPWPLPAAADTAAVLPPLKGTITARAGADGLRRLVILKPALEAIDAKGDVTAAVQLDGSGRLALAEIDFQFKNCSLAVPGVTARLESISGPFRVSDTELLIPLATFTVGGLQLNGRGTIGFAPFTLDLAVTGENLDLARGALLPADPVLPRGLTVVGTGNLRLQVARAGEKTAVTGELALNGCAVALADPKLDFASVTGTVSFAPNELRFRALNATALDGKLQLDGAAKLGGPGLPFAFTVRGTNLGLVPLLAAVSGPETARGGTLDCQLTLQGDSVATATYRGNGWVDLRNPQFSDVPMLARLAPYLGLKNADLLARFDTGTAAFGIADGKVTFTDPARLHNDQVDLAAVGAVAFAGALDLKGSVRVPNSSLAGLIGGIPLGRLGGVKNEDGKTVIGFTVGGTMSEPSYGLDATASDLLGLPAAVLAAPGQLLEGVLERIFGGTDADTAPAPPPTPRGETAPLATDTDAANPLRLLDDLRRLWSP